MVLDVLIVLGRPFIGSIQAPSQSTKKMRVKKLKLSGGSHSSEKVPIMAFDGLCASK